MGSAGVAVALLLAAALVSLPSCRGEVAHVIAADGNGAVKKVSLPPPKAAAAPSSSAQSLVDYLRVLATQSPPASRAAAFQEELEVAAVAIGSVAAAGGQTESGTSNDDQIDDDLTLEELSGLLLHSDVSTQTEAGAVFAAAAAADDGAAVAPAPPPTSPSPAHAFAFQPTAPTPEMLAALSALAPAAAAPAAAAAAQSSSEVLRWLLQSIRISGDTLFNLRVVPELEEALQQSIRSSVAGQSAVAPQHVAVVAATNVTLPLAFRGVSWDSPAAAAALRAALERLGGGFDRGHIQVVLDNPLTLSSSAAAARAPAAASAAAPGTMAQPLRHRMLLQGPPAAPPGEAFVTATFSDMSVSNATYLLDALGGACGGANRSLTADRPLLCSGALLDELKLAGAVPDAAAYSVRLREKPASTITLTLGLGLTSADVAGGAEARAASWLSSRDLRSFLRNLNLTATPLTGLAALLPALGGGLSGSPSITVTITPPGQLPALSVAGQGAGAGQGGGSGRVNQGWVAGVAVAGGVGSAALVGVLYLIVTRRRPACGGSVGGSEKDEDEAEERARGGGAGTSTGGSALVLGRRRRRRGPRVYNQQKDLTTQLAQARTMQARAREEGARREEDLQRQEAAAEAAEQQRAQQQQQPLERGQSGGSWRGAAANRGGASSHHLQRGDSVMSAAQYELDEDEETGSAAPSGPASERPPSGPASSSSSNAIVSSGSRAPRELPPADGAGAARAAVSWGEDEEIELAGRRGGGGGGGGGDDGGETAAVVMIAAASAASAAAASAASAASSSKLTYSPSLEVGARHAERPGAAAALQAASAPATPTGGCAAGDYDATQGFKYEVASGDEGVEDEEAADPDAPLPVRPVTGQLASPFAAWTYPSSP
jgi:hypothetical protein